MFSRLVDTTSVESVVSGTNELFVGCPLALKTGFHSSSKTYLRFLACSQFAKCSALVENSSYECSNLSEKSQVTEPGHPPPRFPHISVLQMASVSSVDGEPSAAMSVEHKW